MIQHRAAPACAGCHARMDPIGFAMENFDAVGRWRERDGEQPIDATGVFPEGTKFDGIAGLKKELLRQPEQFVGTVAERLLMYAIGRNLQYYDAPAVRAVMRDAEPANHTLASLVLGIVKSRPFQMREAGRRVMFVTQEGAAAADVPACHGHDDRAAVSRRDGAGALGARPQADAALRLRLHRQRRHPEPVDAGDDRRRLRADADAAAVRQRARQDQRPQRPLAPAGRHLRRRHRRSSARVGGVADRRARLRPHAAGRRSEAGDDRRSAHRRARSARRRAFRRSRCRSISRRRAPATRATASM